MDPAQELHADRRVLAGLHPCAQTLPTIPQITGHFSGGCTNSKRGCDPGFTRAGLLPVLPDQSSDDQQQFNQESGEKLQRLLHPLVFPSHPQQRIQGTF